ncbi:bifunctional tRNA (5-methylaminomethyl-2-thiouridine)(34)-methyltransferase MnmD/FAD-dependent 5-carboxymethylaminomethyl-2-thiouridine(34) oxidoreductase MnmC [Candidatus Sororendozoicomonas aggregata]|uniref:bifunctional tRNA (5-methylaminomethyl-2-thiouridine)(34)-methyltransferase MnmD/FAD-dependent 5-carboxymethylaminomethyl-2-thiouridine(34) oxidoreductase MnmC n=1 Tax=Candidatus Sororendozoicomonas aggregata TaxID=3073239 RepID=UPI002ED1DD37
MPVQSYPDHYQGLRYADVSWNDSGQPSSSYFNDIYFSTASGIEEKKSVFLAGNQLEARFKALSPGSAFVIGETGFGTGLSFLCAWQLFEQAAPKGCQLHFISTESQPLRQNDLTRALALWPQLSAFSRQLLEGYLPASKGFHHLRFSGGRIRLTLLLGHAPDMLSQLNARVNTWFLDGFSPAKNPDMWQPSLFTTLAQKSADDATYATFSSARLVRDGLMGAGFSVNKTPGFGAKRDRLSGELKNKPPLQPATLSWHQYPAICHTKTAVVIGGGLAGTSCARSLAERGWHVTLLERHNRLATEASGNPQGMLYAKLSANDTPLSRLVAQGYCYTLNLIKQLDTDYPGLRHACGLIQLCTSDKVRQRYQALTQQFPPDFLRLLDKKSLSDIAGLPVEYDGLYFPEAGWVDPRQLCQALVNHPNITVKTHTAVESLKKGVAGWQLIMPDDKAVLTSDVVVCAGGGSISNVEQLSHIPLKAIRGQTTQIAATGHSGQLHAVVCGAGYIAPAMDTGHTLGATFDFHSQSTAVTEGDHQQNLAMQDEWFPAFTHAAGGDGIRIQGGKAGFRSTTPDYLPVVGPVIDKADFLRDFALLRKNAKHPYTEAPPFLEGLYISAGHGSRGLITCPLAGELLASMINHEPAPVPVDIVHGLNPSRFLVRDLSRNKI